MTNKFALLIGINYFGTESQLSGCINDVNSIAKLLIEKFGYIKENIIILSDDNPDMLPTKENILTNIDLIVHKSYQEFSEIWFHYSGHGYYTVDLNNDEKDGYDEMIIPCDHEKNGIIIDDELYNRLVKTFNIDCRLIGIMDSCHSGTCLDLPYILNNGGWERSNNKLESLSKNICMISGSRDDQTSADALINGKWEGAMTWSLITVLKNNNYKISFSDLINEMKFLLKTKNYTQIPQLSFSYPIETNKLFYGNITDENPEIPDPKISDNKKNPIKKIFCCFF